METSSVAVQAMGRLRQPPGWPRKTIKALYCVPDMLHTQSPILMATRQRSGSFPHLTDGKLRLEELK